MSWCTEERIIGIIREDGAGAKLSELCRRHHVSRTTFSKWRARYGGMTGSDAKRLKALEEEENRRLTQLLAEAMLDNQALKGLCWQETGDARSTAAGGGDRSAGAWAIAPPGVRADRDLARRGRAGAETGAWPGAVAQAASGPRR